MIQYYWCFRMWFNRAGQIPKHMCHIAFMSTIIFGTNLLYKGHLCSRVTFQWSASRREMMALVHAPYLGTEKYIWRARDYIYMYWPQMSTKLKEFMYTSKCDTCLAHQATLAKESPQLQQDFEWCPWFKTGTDFASFPEYSTCCLQLLQQIHGSRTSLEYEHMRIYWGTKACVCSLQSTCCPHFRQQAMIWFRGVCQFCKAMGFLTQNVLSPLPSVH